ncbi:MAG: UDP-N-acetylmuramate--L-alanine ligase [Firmicutes bacterium]|nr:UDP-N-acetylmuramate--L-alanine ligase [Bacillota bacterium]
MKHLHFVGIGGARLRGLAKIYCDRGFEISGSDREESKEVKKLAALGIKIYIGHHPGQINGADLVVYTNAVGLENPEVLAAIRQGIPIMEGAELLGKLMAETGQGIAIAGTHGKTTTSAMTALILTENGLDPTVLIGGELKYFNGNHRTGKSSFMVVEACEFNRSFLKLKPQIELITNIDWDHPDCFPTLNDVVKVFEDFVSLLPGDGILFGWGDDSNVYDLKNRFPGKCVFFGYQPQFDWSVDKIQTAPPLGITAQLLYKGKPQGKLALKVPGRHNLQNAMGAIAIASELGVSLPQALKSISDFTGVGRRFEFKGVYKGAVIVDDYAHHPGAIRSTLAAARQVFQGRIFCVFQPHLFSRTKYLLQDFAQSFTDSDILILADIYAAREVNFGEISSLDLYKITNRFHPNAHFLGDFNQITAYLLQNLQPGDLLITMGAGDIWKVGERLLAT